MPRGQEWRKGIYTTGEVVTSFLGGKNVALHCRVLTLFHDARMALETPPWAQPPKGRVSKIAPARFLLDTGLESK